MVDAGQCKKVGEQGAGDAPETLLTIGEMARLNGVSEKALRIYQAKGILEPACINPKTGYRSYTLGQCAALDMIQQLREVGFSLDQIAEVLQAGDVATLQERLRRHIEDVEEQMHRLSMAHQVGGDLLRSCAVYLNKPPVGQLALETIPERRVLVFPLARPDESSVDADGQRALGAWELNLRQVKREIAERGLPASLFRTVGCTIAREDLLAGRIFYQSAFVFVTPAFGADVYDRATRIPACAHLTEYVDGALTCDGRERETVEIARMLEECERRGLEPAGDYRGEVIADGPAFMYEGREMMFKMCLPVRLVGQQDWDMPEQRDVMAGWRSVRDDARRASLFHEGEARGLARG